MLFIILYSIAILCSSRGINCPYLIDENGGGPMDRNSGMCSD